MIFFKYAPSDHEHLSCSTIQSKVLLSFSKKKSFPQNLSPKTSYCLFKGCNKMTLNV